MPGDFTTRKEVAEIYRKRARLYDISANLYYLIGFREQHYRRRAVARLDLRPGDTVMEIGCGTGLNFHLIESCIGAGGHLVGVDLSPEMLARARSRVHRRGWRNVELVAASAAEYEFPPRVDGILSTFALTLEPDYDAVVARGARSLAPGRRWVVADLRIPRNRLRHLAPLLVWLVRPFAVSLKVAERRPWDSLTRHLTGTTYEETYLGVVYIASGRAPDATQPRPDGKV